MGKVAANSDFRLPSEPYSDYREESLPTPSSNCNALHDGGLDLAQIRPNKVEEVGCSSKRVFSAEGGACIPCASFG